MTADAVTQSEPATGTPATGTTGRRARFWSHASAHARARETSSPGAGSATIGRFGAWLRSQGEAPEIWSAEMPAVERIWLQGRYGKQVPETGFVRALVTLWAAIACAIATPVYLVAWAMSLGCYLGQTLPSVDVLSAGRPAPREIWRTGTHDPGWFRRGWTVLAITVTLVCYQTVWITSRISRAIAAALVYVVLAHVLPLPAPDWMR
jgi:hypothetical protein